MYDLQDDIRQVTEEVKAALEEQTDTLLAGQNEIVDEVQKNRDAILASKAEVLNFIAKKNEEMLEEMRGMKDYLAGVFQVRPTCSHMFSDIIKVKFFSSTDFRIGLVHVFLMSGPGWRGAHGGKHANHATGEINKWKNALLFYSKIIFSSKYF